MQGQLKNTFEYEEQGYIMQEQPTQVQTKNTFEYEEQGCIKQGQANARATQKHL